MIVLILPFVVPPPDVNISIVRYKTPLYAGTSLKFTCTVTLNQYVDNNENVIIEWNGPRNIHGDRYLVTAASSSNNVYIGHLTIKALADQDDDNIYKCIAIITGGTTIQQDSGDLSIPTIGS